MNLIATALDKLSNAVGKYWYIVLGALAVLLLLCIILFIVIACKNKRIRKLKEDNKKTRLKLEMERSRARNEQMHAPVTGTQVFGEQEQSEQPEQTQPEQAQTATTQTTGEQTKKQPKPEPTVIPVNRNATAQPAEEPSFITRDFSESSEDDETVTEEIESEPDQTPVKRRKPATPVQEEMDRATRSVSYFNRTSVIKPKSGNVKFIVKYDRNKDTWVVKKEGVDKPVRRVDTKEEAMNIARALCKKYNASLVVHKKDGKFQRQ